MICWFSYLTWRMLRMLLSPGLLVMWCDKSKNQGFIQLYHTESAAPTLLAPCAQCLAPCPLLSHILICFFHPVSWLKQLPSSPGWEREPPGKQHGLKGAGSLPPERKECRGSEGLAAQCYWAANIPGLALSQLRAVTSMRSDWLGYFRCP